MRWIRITFGLLVASLAATSGASILATVLPWPTEAEKVGLNGPFPVPEGPGGPLAGLVVYLSAGHGWLLHRRHHDGPPIAWGRQRGRRFGMVEDDWTAAYVADYLAPALEAEGAVVIALRERDRNPVAAISDDADISCFAEQIAARVEDPLAHEEGYLRLEPNGGAMWWLEVPYDGHWYLYSRWVDDPEHDPQAIYTVITPGEVREEVVDQTVHGGHYWPLGDYCLFGGDIVEVRLNGSGGGMLSADAVRLGGGSFHIVPEFDGKLREHTQFEVAMPHQVDALGAAQSVVEYECGNPVSDMRMRPRWASWASPEGEDAVYLSIHTNASPRGRADGLTVFAGIDRTPPTPAYPDSLRIADLMEQHIHAKVRRHDKAYRTRGARLGNYSEISPVHNELPGALLELGFHTDRREAARLQSHRFKVDATEGIVAALQVWWEERPGEMEPEPDPEMPDEAPP
ncbi:MAG: N-acetylmuramoyl-L-alanine amidase [Myxococcales bacterium]|nr:N-acetylmuramoyl-L-alanine amidase [Myxococcales bacterium]